MKSKITTKRMQFTFYYCRFIIIVNLNFSTVFILSWSTISNFLSLFPNKLQTGPSKTSRTGFGSMILKLGLKSSSMVISFSISLRKNLSISLNYLSFWQEKYRNGSSPKPKILTRMSIKSKKAKKLPPLINKIMLKFKHKKIRNTWGGHNKALNLLET